MGRRCRPRGAGRAGLGATRGPAEESTLRRAFALAGPDGLYQVLGAWLHTRAVLAGGRLVIAIDGKTVRGAKDNIGKVPHLVAALAHGIGAVLGQVGVDAKSNEIPAVRDLLKAFTDLAGAVITIDAMQTQSDTAQVVIGRGADYLITVKGNMPGLYRQLRKLPWTDIPVVSSVSTGHGRRVRRTIKVALAPAWIGFALAAREISPSRDGIIIHAAETPISDPWSEPPKILHELRGPRSNLRCQHTDRVTGICAIPLT